MYLKKEDGKSNYLLLLTSYLRASVRVVFKAKVELAF
ncbi:hypothetical protein SAMN05443669_100923 [Flavobacterium xanthum]|uniref:Uncharacterized protein n=1 Tax=Flavobacterium xanthum TaxID=69322 RepID=A0A1M7BIF9_9FLAO|nr:hypothetical protein SAMN05443669_100923 [Flavobacterium xanthum]